MKLSRGENITKVTADGVEVPFNYVETINWSSGGLSASTSPAYGLTYISMTGTDPSSSPYVLSLGAPIPGVEKTIILDSTAAWANTIDIDLGANVGVDTSTTNRFIYFSTLGTNQQSINLVGLTTALWCIKSVDSTLGSFGAATGIRAGTAARTS